MFIETGGCRVYGEETDLALEERGRCRGVRFRGSRCRSGRREGDWDPGDGGRGV